MKKLSLLLLGLFVIACAKERPTKHIIPSQVRLSVKDLKDVCGNVCMAQKTMDDVRFAGDTSLGGLPVGFHLISDKLVQFRFTETTLDVVSVDPLFKETKPVLESTLIASFPIKHVDVLPKQNPDGDNTYEEEETDTRRPWQERSYVILDATKDTQDEFVENAASANVTALELTADSLNLAVTRQMKVKDSRGEAKNASAGVRYSFLKFTPNETYQQREYPLDLKLRFGYFTTETMKFDKYGRILQADRKIFMNRWDTSKKVVYYFSKNFPEHLKEPSRKVFAGWNESFKAATGHDVLEIRENTGQELGDLRYSMITYDDTVDASHGILGYGPSVANPRTGEIIKGDVILYGGVLKNSLYRERNWEKLLGDFNPLAVPEAPVEQSPGKILVPGQGLANMADVLAGKTLAKNTGRNVINRSLLQNLRREMKAEKVLAELEKDKHNRLKRNATEVDVLTSIEQKTDVSKMTDEELEVVIFMPLLTHELGHNLGLRHNFAGSFDGKHFEGEVKSSSVMDYGFLFSQEAPTPAPYDRAAIQAAYTSDDAVTAKLMADNYYFCTDEDTMSSETAFCNQHDAGVTLAKVVESEFLRYNASWFFDNLRLDRVVFQMDQRSYQQRVASKIIPIRLMYDNANAILQAATETDSVSLWRLVRQRIEADPTTKTANIERIQLMTKIILDDAEKGFKIRLEHLERVIDKAKIEAVIKDAVETRRKSLIALAQLILDESKPLNSGGNLVEAELEIKGILINKLLGILFTTMNMPDPLGTGKVISIYNQEPILRSVLNSLLSNTQFFEDDKEFAGYDINLRDMAFNVLTNEMVASGASPIAKETLAIEKRVLDKNDPEVQAQTKIRTDMRSEMKKILIGNLSADQLKVANETLAKLQSELSKTRLNAYATVGNQVFVSPVALDGNGMETASGRMISVNVTTKEDMQRAAKEIKGELQANLKLETTKPENERDTAKIAALLQQIAETTPQLDGLIDQMTNDLAEQKFFLDRFYNFYALGQLERDAAE